MKSELLDILKEVTVIKVLLTWIIYLVAPVQEAVIIAITLCLLDMVLGVIASKKEGYAVTSRSMRRTWHKIVIYSLGLVLLHWLDVLAKAELLLGFASVLIAIIEGKSIFENLYRLTKIDFLKIIISKIELVYDETFPTSSKDLIKPYKGKKKLNENNEKKS